MISCDTNVLFAACDQDNSMHSQARDFFETHLNDGSFVLCEQVLMELYCLLRNPSVSHPPLSAAEAVTLIEHWRSNPAWRMVDVPGDAPIMDEAWGRAGRRDFAFRRIFDVRLALTLCHHGVTDFATRNTRDFEGLGFNRVWNPFA